MIFFLLYLFQRKEDDPHDRLVTISLNLSKRWREILRPPRSSLFPARQCVPRGRSRGSRYQGLTWLPRGLSIVATFKASGKTWRLPCTVETPENDVGYAGRDRGKLVTRVSEEFTPSWITWDALLHSIPLPRGWYTYFCYMPFLSRILSLSKIRKYSKIF